MANEKKSGSKKKIKLELRDVAKARQALTKEMAKKVKGGQKKVGDDTFTLR
jgi:hypothetical protein